MLLQTHHWEGNGVTNVGLLGVCHTECLWWCVTQSEDAHLLCCRTIDNNHAQNTTCIFINRKHDISCLLRHVSTNVGSLWCGAVVWHVWTNDGLLCCLTERGDGSLLTLLSDY